MIYRKYSMTRFFREIDTEQKARKLIWASRFGKDGFRCSCGSKEYFAIQKRPEVRECRSCKRQLRLRSGTVFMNSKLPLLVWVRAIFLITRGKRGISALELQRTLELTRYETAWTLLHRIRHALSQRDQIYKIGGMIELDGAKFGRLKTGNQGRVIIGIETKSWTDEKGVTRSKAGFAKIVMGHEGPEQIGQILAQVEAGSTVKTDGLPVYKNNQPEGLEFQSSTTGNIHKERAFEWQPWVHKFISNAKTWVLGTHHGVETKYLGLYLAEYTYRFNRRHAVETLFDRALRACALSTPITLPALTG